jgi:hypothetical protein
LQVTLPTREKKLLPYLLSGTRKTDSIFSSFDAVATSVSAPPSATAPPGERLAGYLRQRYT